MRKTILTSAALLSCGAQLSGAAFAAPKQPNILWIITDDQRADALACWNMATRGDAKSELGFVSSPNIDALAAEGVLFTSTFCNSPVSAPSRASMHTGRYPHHNGIPDFRLTHNQNDFAQPLITDIMREQGYKTTLFGKLGVRISENKDKPSFGTVALYDEKISMENDMERVGVSDWCKKAIFGKGQAQGDIEQWFYPDGSKVEYYIKRKAGELTPEDLATRAAMDKKHHIIRIPGSTAVIGGESPMPTKRTLDGVIASEFISYLNHENESYKLLNGRTVQGPDTKQAQFFNLGFHFPHTAVMPSKEYRDKFLKEKYNLPEFTEEEWSKMPAQVKAWQKNAAIKNLTQKEKEQIIRDYYAFCAMGDQLLGEAVAEFKEYCKRNDQEYIIVFACGDHGWHLGEQGVCRKGSGYVKSNQTAVVVVSSYDKKNFPAGKVVDDLVEYVDFFPTFLTTIGLDVKDERFDYLDGRPLQATASGKVTPRDYVLGETSVGGGPRGYLRAKDFAFSMKLRPHFQAPSAKVRPNKNIKWGIEAPREQVDMMLFDLRVDPKEQNNLANDKEYAALADWFRAKLGNIMLGDDRVEVNWNTFNDFDMSSFAKGSDDKKLDIPSKLIPKVSKR